MADQLPDAAPGWLQSLGLMIGGGGIGAVILEIIRRRLPSIKAEGETAERYAERLRSDYEALQKRCQDMEEKHHVRVEALEAELAAERQLNMQQFRINTGLETENRLLRSRYHRMRGYVMMILNRLGKAIGEEAMSNIPEWVDEYVAGPTAESPALPPAQQEGSSHG